MASKSLKPYLLDGFYRWCVDDAQTPQIQFLVTPDCVLPKKLRDGKEEQLTLNISPSACHNLRIDNDGVSFTARFEGAAFKVYIPLGALVNIFSRESKRELKLNFSEVVIDLDQPFSSGTPSIATLDTPAHQASMLALVRPQDTAQRTVPAPRKNHLSLVKASPPNVPEGTVT